MRGEGNEAWMGGGDGRHLNLRRMEVGGSWSRLRIIKELEWGLEPGWGGSEIELWIFRLPGRQQKETGEDVKFLTRSSWLELRK